VPLINKPNVEPDELIAIFQNTTGLNLLSTAFEYIGGNTPNSPSNDNFANAFTLTGSVINTTGSNVGATGEFSEPISIFIDVAPLNSVWWKWTAPSSGNVNINTAGSNFDTVLDVYTGSSISSGLVSIASNDDSGGVNTSSVNFTTVSGTTYQISVDGYQAQTGNINLGLSFASNTSTKSDFNADRKADILFRDKATGQNAIWLMDGLNPTAQSFISPAETNFDIVGIRDFNGDEKADILFRDRSRGQNAIWLMNGLNPIVQAFIPPAEINFQIVGV